MGLGGVGVYIVTLLGIYSRASKILRGVIVCSSFRWLLLVNSA